MSRQESYSVLTELPLIRKRPGPTGTTHILAVDRTKATVSDPKHKILNGDTVIWRITNPSLAGTDSAAVSFTGPSTMLSVPGRNPGTSDVKVDISEWVGDHGAAVVHEQYQITINGSVLSFARFHNSITPELVIDSMGGM